MRLVATHFLKENTKIAQTVYNEHGQVLVNAGLVLTARMIRRLQEIGIPYVYIEDDRTKDIQIKNPVSQETKREAISAIQETFEFMKSNENSKLNMYAHIGKNFSKVVSNILDDLRNHKEAISLMADAFSYDNYIFTHSLNVTIYSLALGLKLNLPKRNLEELGLGALLHDIGKTAIPLDILTKPSRLTDEEFAIIKTHTVHGFEILRHEPNIPLLAAHCAFQHHERMDGSGYPRGLKGEEIHPYSRIIGVADVYDACTSNRVYRKAMLPHEALEILYAGAGTQFEPKLIEKFRQAVVMYPNGLTLTLHDNRKAIVIRQNEYLNDRPVVRIIEENGKALSAPYEIDLAKELNVTINQIETNI